MLSEVESVTAVNAEHEVNALTPILVTELGMMIEINPDPLNAPEPILIRDVESVTSVNAEHEVNASAPILSTELGSVIEVNPVPLNA